jgi:LuxR family maltose regulon positive regulatory protein
MSSDEVGPSELSPRERDVLRLLASDLSLHEIARELFVSYNTIKTQTRSIYRKLVVSSRAEAVARSRNEDSI